MLSQHPILMLLAITSVALTVTSITTTDLVNDA